MTACTNHGGKARRVVTAALVGVLSVGTVPMVALAAGAEADGISTMALNPATALSEGKMTEATDGQGRRLDIPGDGIITVEAGQWVKPTEVTPKDADPVEIISWEDSGNDADVQTAKVTYTGPAASGVVNEPSSTVTSADFMTPGVYTVEVEMTKGIYAGHTFKTTFIVEAPADLANATVFDNSNGNVSDTTFTYNGQAQKIGVAVNGKILDEATDYDIDLWQIKDQDGNDVTSAPVSVTSITDAGTYVADIYEEGKSGTGLANVKKQVTFTVEKLDLSTSDVSITDVQEGTINYETAVKTVTVDGFDFGNDSSATGLQATATLPTNTTGKASAIVTPGTNKNVTGKATVEFNVVKSVVDDVSYNSTPVVWLSGATLNSDTVNVNLADGESFKPERIEVFSNAGEELDASYYTVSYTDDQHDAVEASALSNPGVYFVTVRVNAAASHFEYGSADLTFKVNVKSAEIESGSDVVFRYDGKVDDEFTKEYDGTDFLAGLETVVHTKWGDDLVAGTDYTVQAYNEDDEKVDEIVNAGDYVVKIELKGNYGVDQAGSGLVSADLECDVHIQAKKLPYGLYANGGELTDYTWNDGPFWRPNYKTTWYVSYTGEDLDPSFELGYYTDAKGNVVEYLPANASDLTWNALTSDEVEVTGYRYDGKPVDVLNAKGDYVVEFALNSDNYQILTTNGAKKNASSNVITVSDKAVAFADVDANAWYAKAVFQAKQLGYVKGVSGTNLYAPDAQISRADALVIISRMAGFDQTVNAEDYLDDNGGFVTRYVDVDKGAYYAKAVAWGTKVGIVSGYQDGSGKFGPNDPITREQFAAMLCNYAKATGDDVATDGSALAALPDAGTVSDWATSAVAWAVDAGVMGNNGSVMGQNQITRGEVAAMAVNYQPEGAGSGVIG